MGRLFSLIVCQSRAWTRPVPVDAAEAARRSPLSGLWRYGRSMSGKRRSLDKRQLSCQTRGDSAQGPRMGGLNDTDATCRPWRAHYEPCEPRPASAPPGTSG